MTPSAQGQQLAVLGLMTREERSKSIEGHVRLFLGDKEVLTRDRLLTNLGTCAEDVLKAVVEREVACLETFSGSSADH
jgi:hypothetical protein